MEGYLTAELKAYYQKDFVDHVLPSTDAYWNFDTELLELVNRINTHPELQTIYSRSFSPARSGLDLNPLSYLKIAYSPSMRLELGKALLAVYNELNAMESPVELQEEAPQTNLNYRPQQSISMGCLSNPEYFRIWHFSISLNTQNHAKHQQFWELMTLHLRF